MATPVNFPDTQVLLINHVTREVKDYAPLEALLFEYYQGDFKRLVAELYDARDFVMRGGSPADSAAQVRHFYAVLTGLTVALDEIRVSKLYDQD